MKILLTAGAVFLVLLLSITYVCFRMVFYVPRKQNKLKKIVDSNHIPLPQGEKYEPYHEMMRRWTLEARAMEHEDYYITSHDGLRLHAKYYEYKQDAVVEIMFHGYKGSAERDLSGGIQRCFALGRNVLMVDQRTSCGSEGNVITFGINEHRDCLAWVDFAVKQFGPEVKIVLTGLSMGASTVLMAAGKPLPSNVVGVLADCGFSVPKDIIKKCAKDIGFMPELVYPFIRLAAKLFGHFDLEEYSAMEAMKTCKIPVIFFHGEEDDYVPCEMSRINYEACQAPKRLVTVKGAGHGLVYVVDNERYFNELVDFFHVNGVPTKRITKITGV